MQVNLLWILLRPTLVQFFSFAVLVSIAASASVNRTIDDQKGDSVTGAMPLYLPTAGAVTWNIGQTCSICTIRGGGDPIDVDEAFDGTWHDTTSEGKPGDPDLIVQASFTGHAVYVYHIVLNALIPGVVTNTNLAFYIDNEWVGAYTYQPGDGTIPPVLYRVPVYSNESLAQGEHLIQIITAGDTPAIVLFDYIVYTTEEDDTPSSIAPPTHTSVTSSITSQASVSSPAAQKSVSSSASLTTESSASVQTDLLPSSQGTASPLVLSRTTAISDLTAQPDATSYVSQANASYPSTSQPNAASSPTSSSNRQQGQSPSHVAEIAGATAGGVAVLVIACLLGALWRSRARRQRGHGAPGASESDARLTLDKDDRYLSAGNPIASTAHNPSEHKPRAFSRVDTDRAQRASLDTTAAQRLSVHSNLLARALQDHEGELYHHRSSLLERALHGPRDRSTRGEQNIVENNPTTLAAMRAEMSALRTMLETQQRTIDTVSRDTGHAPPAYAI